MAGPYDAPPLPSIRCSGLGVVPKKDGGWRTIYDLSSPTGSSVNDFIDPARFSLHYCTIDAATAILNTLGPGTLMGKMDLKNTFCLLPVRRLDWHLLGIFWQNHWYLDKCLPFGLRSSPFLFNQLAEALEWILINNYSVANIIHYLDDFFTAGPPDSPECLHNMTAMSSLYEHVNAQLKSEKTEGPTTTLTFLGIKLNSVYMTASISAERKAELLHSLHSILASRTCTKRTLLSLIGKLSFTCKVVPPGRIFLRRLIDLSTSVSRLYHHVTLTSMAKADLHWWIRFVPPWPGTILLLQIEWTPAPGMQFYTFSLPWPPHLQHHSITWREMYAVLVACSTWGMFWQRKRILFHCDNQAVVAVWEKGTSKCPHIMSLVRALFFTAATHNFHLCIVHIPGTNNCIADHLSAHVSPCRPFGLQPQQQTSQLPQSSPLLCRPLPHGTARPTAGPRRGAINQADLPCGCSPICPLLLPLSASSPSCLCSHPFATLWPHFHSQ